MGICVSICEEIDKEIDETKTTAKVPTINNNLQLN